MTPAEEVAKHLLVDFAWEGTCPGTMLVRATVPSFPFPVGVVWFRFEPNATISVYQSFVTDHFRRCGVRSAIHRAMLARYPSVRRVVTGRSTADGQAWLAATGFRRLSNGDWEYRRRKGD